MRILAQLWRLTQSQIGALRHQRLAWVLGLAVLLLVGGSAALGGFDFGGGGARVVRSFAVGSTLAVGTLLIALAAPSLFMGGLASRTLELWVSRGVSRTVLLLAQALALLVAAGWLIVSGAIATGVVLMLSGHAEEWLPACRALGLGAMPLLVLVGVGMFAATVGRSVLFAAVVTLAFAVAGHLAAVLAHAAAASEGAARVVWTALAWIVPNFAAMQAAGGWGLVAAVAYGGVFLIAAIGVFARREL